MSDEPVYGNVAWAAGLKRAPRSVSEDYRTNSQETWSPAQAPEKTEHRYQPQQCAVVFLSLTCAFLLAGIIALSVCYYLSQNAAGQLKKENGALMEANQQLQGLKSNLTALKESLESENTQLRKDQTLLESRCARCPSGWTFYNSKCYFVYLGQTWKTWNESRLECIKMGADLLTIQNKEEQMFIMYLAPKYYDNWHGYWIGLTRQAQHWVWVNGSSLTTGFWADAERQNGTHILTNIKSTTLNSWREAWPEMRNRWICENKALLL